MNIVIAILMIVSLILVLSPVFLIPYFSFKHHKIVANFGGPLKWYIHKNDLPKFNITVEIEISVKQKVAIDQENRNLTIYPVPLYMKAKVLFVPIDSIVKYEMFEPINGDKHKIVFYTNDIKQASFHLESPSNAPLLQLLRTLELLDVRLFSDKHPSSVGVDR